ATLFLQHVPTGFSKASLRDVICRAGFGDAYDYLYLPMCFLTKSNKGYAFMNFVNEDMAELFMRQMDGYPMAEGMALVVTSSRTQGLGANLILWARSQSRRVRNPEFLPYVRALSALGMVHPSELWSRGPLDEPKQPKPPRVAAAPTTWASGARASACAERSCEPPEANSIPKCFATEEPKPHVAAGTITWTTGPRACTHAESGGDAPGAQWLRSEKIRHIGIGEVWRGEHEVELGPARAGGFTSAILAHGLANAVVLDRFSV
ncbi:unnamed protein product, partial [Prorocentrum cordatum]